MMSIYINHCWCSDSNWGECYNCRVILTITRYAEREDVFKNNQTNDWKNLVEEIPFVRKEGFGIPLTYRLKPKVIEWLKANVKDRECDEQKQGWAVGTDDYNADQRIQFNVFFGRPTDAMKFIKHFSAHKKPVDYFNYFKGIRRKLDLTTNQLKRVDR